MMPTPDIEKLRDAVQAVLDWDAKANPPNDLDDEGCEFLNEDGWDAFKIVADKCRAALDSLPSPVSVPEGDAREIAERISFDWYSTLNTGPCELADRIAAALLSERSRALPQWQPIETARKDGTEILAWFTWYKGMRCKARWNKDEYAKKPRPYWSTLDERVYGTRLCRESQPTHWQPLPAPPSSPEEG